MNTNQPTRILRGPCPDIEVHTLTPPAAREGVKASPVEAKADFCIVIDGETGKALVCQWVVSYDGVNIYRPIPGRNYENHEDAIRDCCNLRGKI